ncbi:lipid A deacylase LpxR family protein [Polaribacter sp. Z014]|uniref:lipid A deacylase LpxR family protein n=1 Tax=Polaribacter sp. Z014 TaxID=2927126 RepID=UPI0020200A5E|nr:lipid A deacylase LpxR family protein [Polaribacter sp. Z014]MCL7764445.1 lipid A deacylase LpxR family protein [Polaribacter sp. Z014]
MKYFILTIIVFVSSYTIAQEKFTKEISLVTDNDLYVSAHRDRYYTSGIFLTYRYLSKKKKTSLEKRILEWQIGQEMYTPYKTTVEDVNDQDRPFAGYLYGSFGIKRIYKNNQIFKTSAQIGVIGTNSYAEELQEFIHDMYGFKKAVGWKYQIKNAFALNFNAEYLKTILETTDNNFDITWVNKVNLGTVYTNISTGFYSRIGLKPLQKLANSIAFNTNLNNNQTDYYREVESFFFIKPMLRYAAYDATLQGSFLNKTSPITNALKPIVFDIELGLKFTVNRLNFGYSFNYNTSKSKDLRYTYGHKYGSIAINYLLR